MQRHVLLPSVLVPPFIGGKRDLTPVEGGHMHKAGGDAIGTSWSLSAVLTNSSQAAEAEAAVTRALALVVAQMSQWEPDSELSRYNRAPAGTAMILSPGFARVLDCALVLARASAGAFDPALGAASDAWGFGPSPAPEHAPATGLFDRRAGWRAIEFDPASRRVTQPGGVMLDLSGIAKGFAVDLASRLLCEAGLPHHLVEIGGELRGAGVKPDGQPWWVDVEAVPGVAASCARVALSGWSIASSGDWLRRRGVGEQSWSHTLSPDTGRPVERGNRGVSVLHRDCMQADGLATLLMAMEPRRALAFAAEHGVPAQVTDARGRVHASPAWRAME